MITIHQQGDFHKLNGFLERMKEVINVGDLNAYGKRGVEALKSATPKESGETAKSWYYKIIRNNGNVSIEWHNSNVNDGCNVAVLIQYGHGTRTGGYVIGDDYINPSLKPVFEEIANDVWKEVNRQ